MPATAPSIPFTELSKIGLRISETIHYQLSPGELVQQTLCREQGQLNDTGALVINTGTFTGRCPKDRFIVRDEITDGAVDWNDINIALQPSYFEKISRKVTNYINNLPEIWIRDSWACADNRFRLPIRVITETPAMNLFAHNMFLRPSEQELEHFEPEWHILSVPGLQLSPGELGVRQPNAVIISFKQKLILIAGTGYTGETKKAIFGVLNFILPFEKNVLSMHCSANIGVDGATAIFFGLSGTGKTTLSADPARKLIGDDEHGWSARGIFNFEGGCYAKCIHLQEDKEPEIFQAIRHGALVENVQFFPGTRQINFDDSTITENTRVSYPLSFIKNSLEPSVGGHPKNIFFLTCDAYGVLPPIAKLSPGQAMYHFISGYTAKVAGTETGIREPKTVFSACFGAPFLPLAAGHYAEMLGRRMKEHGANVWLINTGWTGGPYGTGTRMKLSYTRNMIQAALDGKLDNCPYESHPVFGIAMPVSCPGVPAAVLNPASTWPNRAEYDAKALELARQFTANFEKYANGLPAEILAAAPLV